MNGDMKCGCKFRLQLSASVFKYPKENVKHPRKRPLYSEGPVTIKSFNYDHTNGCEPSLQQYQFCCSRTGRYVSQTPIQVYWQLCSHIKRSAKQSVSSSTIRSALAGSFPDTVNITKQDIFNTRVRCRRLMPVFNQSKEFKTFEDQLNSDSIFLKKVESDFYLEQDESTQMIHEIFDSMFNNDNERTNVNDITDSEYVWKFQDYLDLISIQARGFQYRLAIGDNEQVNGAIWMTASMRSNMERFGSYICLDTMKRKLNTLGWP